MGASPFAEFSAGRGWELLVWKTAGPRRSLFSSAGADQFRFIVIRAEAIPLLPFRLKTNGLALGFEIKVRVTDRMVADHDRFDIGGDDPDLLRAYDDAVVVENRLAIKPGLTRIALLGCRLQRCFRAFQLGFQRVLCQFGREFLLCGFFSRLCRIALRIRQDEHVGDQNRDEAACREPERVPLPWGAFHYIGDSSGFEHFRLLDDRSGTETCPDRSVISGSLNRVSEDQRWQMSSATESGAAPL